MSSTIAAMRSKLMSALSKIGRNNGHACPETTNNYDPVMHEYLVSTDAHAFFGKRRDEAKKELLVAAGTQALDDCVEGVVKSGVRDSVTMLTGDRYALVCDVKAPAKRLDQKKLRSDLILDHDWSEDEVDELLDGATVSNAPAKTFKVIAAE